MENNSVVFASGLVRYNQEQQLLVSGNQQIVVPEKQLLVLEPLVRNLGEIVLTNELIARTGPDIMTEQERYKQSLRVQASIVGLRKNFDRLLDGLGDPTSGIIFNEFGKGYTLLKYWTPEI